MSKENDLILQKTRLEGLVSQSQEEQKVDKDFDKSFRKFLEGYGKVTTVRNDLECGLNRRFWDLYKIYLTQGKEPNVAYNFAICATQEYFKRIKQLYKHE